MKNQIKVTALGEVLWDIHNKEKTFGGAPANFACHCAELGASTSLISCIGNDLLGKEGIDFLKNKNVKVSSISTHNSLETGVVNVELDKKGIPSYIIKENVAWDFIPYHEEGIKIIKDSDAICFGSLSQRHSISRHSIQSYLSNSASNCLKIFDINIRQHYYSHNVLIDSLKAANALKLNDDELILVAKLLNLKGTQKELLKIIQEKFNLKLAIVTCGAKGALILTEKEESFELAPEPLEIKSTVGAGDAFTAAAVIGFLQGKPIAKINKHANAVASFVCSHSEAVPVLTHKLKTM